MIALSIEMLAAVLPLRADPSSKIHLTRRTVIDETVLKPGNYDLRVEDHGDCATVKFMLDAKEKASITSRWEEWVNPFGDTGLYYRGSSVAGLHFAGHKKAMTFEDAKTAGCDVTAQPDERGHAHSES